MQLRQRVCPQGRNFALCSSMSYRSRQMQQVDKSSVSSSIKVAMFLMNLYSILILYYIIFYRVFHYKFQDNIILKRHYLDFEIQFVTNPPVENKPRDD